MNKIFIDEALGEVLFRRSTKAKRYNIKIIKSKVSVVLPMRGSYKVAYNFFKENREKIIDTVEKQKLNPVPQYDEKELLEKAKLYLPQRLFDLARNNGFIYKGLTIRNSKTRWGSCSSKKNINLSIYMMILPPHLIDYVILHELCHTIHMNHSPEFWALLDKYTGNKAKALRQEMKQYKF